MRVLLIGGTAFMGPHVARQLLDGGHEVAVIHRGVTEEGVPDGVTHIHAGAVEGEESFVGWQERLPRFADDIRAFAPDVALHMIAMIERNAVTAQEVLRGIARRLVLISSQDVYRAYGRLIGTEPGEPDALPITEDSPLREKRYPYRQETPRPSDDPRRWMDDYDKIPIEQVVLGEPALPGTVLRLPAVYGPGDKQHRTFEYLKRMDDGRPAIIIPANAMSWRWTRGYVENVAHAIALAVTDDRASGRTYNVGELEPLTQAEWVRAIGDAAGWHGDVLSVPPEDLPQSLAFDDNTAQEFVCDSSRIRRELGYTEQVPRDEAFRRTVAWERAHPPATLPPDAYDYAAEDRVIAAQR